MLLSKQYLMHEANATGYRPEILEKIYQLLNVFRQFLLVPYLKERLVLKGGTALNLFCFEKAPRLSVDIDLNYIGSSNKETMLAERIIVMQSIEQIMQQNRFILSRSPTHYAGGKTVWLYDSALTQRGQLEIDINFMYREPLWPIVFKKANISNQTGWEAPVLDIHELAAGKFAALFDRCASRDLFDAHHLLTNTQFDLTKLRLAFVVYVAHSKINLEELNIMSVEYELKDLKNRLLPMLDQKKMPRTLHAIEFWSNTLVNELREALTSLLPLESNEKEFIQQIRYGKQINANLITNEPEMAIKINRLPVLLWVLKRESKDNII